MAYNALYEFIRDEIKTLDKDLNVSSIIDKYKSVNNHEIAVFVNKKDNFKVINQSINNLKNILNNNTNKEKITDKINELIKKLNQNNGSFNIENSDVDSTVYILLIYSLILFIVNSNNYHKNITNDFKEKTLISLEKGRDGITFYRGHSNASWTMQPCFVRGLKESAIIDKKYINARYTDAGILDKFNRTLNVNKAYINNLYFMYSFIQHSVSYSILIDLTSNPTIGTSFALSNTNSINDFNNVDSSLIQIKVKDNRILTDEKEIDEILKTKSFVLLRDKICFGKDQVVSKRTIHFNSFKEILKHMKPEYNIFEYPTSDRMKYQQGSFVYFYGSDLIVFKDRIFYELCDDLEMTEYKISCGANKRNLVDFIKKERGYYDQEHLMNPYKYFNE